MSTLHKSYYEVLDDLYKGIRNGTMDKISVSNILRSVMTKDVDMDTVLSDFCTLLTALQENGFVISRGIKGLFIALKQLKYHLVYFLKRGNTIVYVGKSTNIFSRLNGHNDKSYNKVCIQYYRSAETCSYAEDHFILKFKPEYNKSVNLANAKKATGLKEDKSREISFFCHKVNRFTKSKRKLDLSKYSRIGGDLYFIINDSLFEQYSV